MEDTEHDLTVRRIRGRLMTSAVLKAMVLYVLAAGVQFYVVFVAGDATRYDHAWGILLMFSEQMGMFLGMLLTFYVLAFRGMAREIPAKVMRDVHFGPQPHSPKLPDRILAWACGIGKDKG